MRNAQENGTPIQIHLTPAAEISVATCSTEQRMLQIIYNRVITRVTTVVGTAALLPCLNSKWKNCHVISFSGWSLSENRDLIVTCAENGQPVHVFILIPMKWEEYRS
jgi:hypothetical protein